MVVPILLRHPFQEHQQYPAPCPTRDVNFDSLTVGIDEAFLDRAATRLFTVGFLYSLRQTDNGPRRRYPVVNWPYPVVNELYDRINENLRDNNKIKGDLKGDPEDFENVFSWVLNEVNRNERLKTAIRMVYFRPFQDNGVDSYIARLRASVSALRFIFELSHLNPDDPAYRNLLLELEDPAQFPFDEFAKGLRKDDRLTEAEKINAVRDAMNETFPGNSEWIEESSRVLMTAPTDEDFENEILLRLIPMLADVNRGGDKPLFAMLNLRTITDAFVSWQLRDVK